MTTAEILSATQLQWDCSERDAAVRLMGGVARHELPHPGDKIIDLLEAIALGQVQTDGHGGILVNKTSQSEGTRH